MIHSSQLWGIVTRRRETFCTFRARLRRARKLYRATYKNVTPAMPRRYKISYPGNSSQCVSHLEQGNSIYTARRMSINPYRFQEDHHLVFGLVSRVWGGIRKSQKKHSIKSNISSFYLYAFIFEGNWKEIWDKNSITRKKEYFDVNIFIYEYFSCFYFILFFLFYGKLKTNLRKIREFCACFRFQRKFE